MTTKTNTLNLLIYTLIKLKNLIKIEEMNFQDNIIKLVKQIIVHLLISEAYRNEY